MNIKQREAAQKAMSEWLEHPEELGKKPFKIECAKEFDLHDLHYYVFKFKTKMLGDWFMGVCGGYEGDDLEHCGHVYSKMQKYDEAAAVEEATAIVEEIRAYWMKQADFQEKFQTNVKFRTQEEITVSDIESAEADIAVTLCELEKIFPPSFFTVMVYLVMHLATEAKFGGPVQYHWMYPIER